MGCVVRTKRGISLVIAIIYVSIFMLVIGSLTQVQLTVLGNLKNKRMEQQTEDLANMAGELGQLWAEAHTDGQNSSDTLASTELAGFTQVLYDAAADLGLQNCTSVSCVGFRVVGRGELYNNQPPLLSGLEGNNVRYFSVPAPIQEFDLAAGNVIALRGSGDAATSCEAVIQMDADDPCHWNKLYFGESVEIPLYYVDATGAVYKPDFNDSGTDIKLRMRTPCADGAATCTPGQRVELYPKITDQRPDPYLYAYRNPSDIPLMDPVLVQWLMSDASDGNETLFARGETKPTRPPQSLRIRPLPIPNISEDIAINTELSAGRINDANPSLIGLPSSLPLTNFIVFEKSYYGNIADVDERRERLIKDFLNQPEVARPILKLTSVAHPRKLLPGERESKLFNSAEVNDKSRDVPYLEYQLLVSGSTPVTDSRASVHAYAQIGDFKKTVRSGIQRPASLGGFALENL